MITGGAAAVAGGLPAPAGGAPAPGNGAPPAPGNGAPPAGGSVPPAAGGAPAAGVLLAGGVVAVLLGVVFAPGRCAGGTTIGGNELAEPEAGVVATPAPVVAPGRPVAADPAAPVG